MREQASAFGKGERAVTIAITARAEKRAMVPGARGRDARTRGQLVSLTTLPPTPGTVTGAEQPSGHTLSAQWPRQETAMVGTGRGRGASHADGFDKYLGGPKRRA